MSEMKIKQTNFRINQETADAFRKFCEENGMNQAQGFDHIMQVVELDKAKTLTPNRQTEIEEFERSIKTLLAAYLNSLELNNNAEARIQEQFASDLKTKDKTISDLQNKVEVLQTEKQTAEKNLSEAQKSVDRAIKDSNFYKEQIETSSQLIFEKEKTITTLAQKLADAEEKNKEYNKIEKEHKDILRKNNELTKQITDMEKDFSVEKKELKTEMERKISDTTKDAALETANAVAAKERELMQQIKELEIKNAKLEVKCEQLTKEEK